MGQEHHCPVRSGKCNSAFRLCYSLQLLPCLNEKHQLITVSPQHPAMNHTQSSMPRPGNRRPAPTTTNGRLTQQQQQQQQQQYSILWVPIIFLTSAAGLYVVSHAFRSGHDDYSLKFPTSLEDIRMMTAYLMHFQQNNFFYLVVLFSYAYLFKQTFAIPGSFLMNLLGGALFGPYLGFTICIILNAIGATLCFLMSQTFGKFYVSKYFPDKVKFFQRKIAENKDGLFFFMLFLRLVPMSPNWAINIISPIVGIPVHTFFFSVFLGMMPYNFICSQTGAALSQISSINDIFTWWTIFKLMIIAVVGLTPGLVIRMWRPKGDKEEIKEC